ASLAGAALAIAALAGFAIWAGVTTHRAVADVQRLTLTSDAYQTARHAVAQENLAARRYQLAPDTLYVRQFNQAHTTLDGALDTVRRLGGSSDLVIANRIEAQNDSAAGWFAKLPRLAVNNSYQQVVNVSDHHLQPTFDSMTAQLDRSGARHR